MVRVGQRLKEERIKKNLTLEDVSKATKIKLSFLSAIEKGEYQNLPSGAYAQGFVRNYAEYLSLQKKEILALFRREFDEEKFFKILPDGLTKQEDFPVKKIKLQQSFFILLSIFLILLSYIAFQYRYAILNPPLKIDSPKKNSTASGKTIIISGKTDPNATLYVNNISVSLDKNGNFKKSLDLFSGKSSIKIKAVNRFGRQTEEERHVEVKQE